MTYDERITTAAQVQAGDVLMTSRGAFTVSQVGGEWIPGAGLRVFGEWESAPGEVGMIVFDTPTRQVPVRAAE